MSAVRKFLFEQSFDAPLAEPRARHPAAPAEAVITRADVAAVEARAREAGHAAGIAEAVGAHEQRLADALAAIDGGLAALIAAEAEIARRAERRAVELTRAIAAKLYPALERRHAIAEILALVEGALAENLDEPRLVLRIGEAPFEEAQRRIAPLAAAGGYAGKLIILVDESLSGSQCRVEWADGGVERDPGRTFQAIEAAIARAIAALGDGTAATPQPAFEETRDG